MRIVENLKSLVLTALILLSLFLTGSLWFDNFRGVSFAVLNISDKIVQKVIPEEEYSKLYEELILPYKVTVINPEGNKWVSYESDKMNSDAWNIIKKKLNSLNEQNEIITGKVEEWSDLINRKSIILEFGESIEYDILNLIIPSLKYDEGNFGNIEKIALTKSLDGYTIYMLQVKTEIEPQKLYKVLLKGKDEEIETFIQSCENIKADVRYITMEELGIKRFYSNKTVIADNSVLIPVQNRYEKRDAVNEITGELRFSVNDEYAMNRFVTEIFNNTDFARFITKESGYIYINDDKSSIKIDNNGLAEYINNGKSSEENTAVKQDFNAALDFINKIKMYDNVYLYSSSKKDGMCVFKFSTACGGIPISFFDGGKEVKTIIEIRVKDGSVKYFKGRLIEFKVSEKSEYIESFIHNILDDILKNVEKGSEVSIEEIGLVYNGTNAGSMYPIWFSKYKVGDAESVQTFISAVKK